MLIETLQSFSDLPTRQDTPRPSHWFRRPRLLRSVYQPLTTGVAAGETSADGVCKMHARRALASVLELGAGGHFRGGSSSAERFYRAYPTSGNLQSVQTYIVDPAGVLGAGRAVLHYDPVGHAVARLSSLSAPSSGVHPGAVVMLSSVPGRQAAKYGPRGFRYAWLDLGHAIGALQWAAGSVGWRAEVIAHERCQLARLLSTEVAPSFEELEDEVPEVVVHLTERRCDERLLTAHWQSMLELERASVGPRAASPRASSPELSTWLRDAERATAGAMSTAPAAARGACAEARTGRQDPRLAAALRRRRTPSAFDGSRPIALEKFERLVTPPEAGDTAALWDTGVLYWVHQVHGMAPGLYAALPQANAETSDGCTRGPLQLVAAGDFRDDAHFLTGFQDKARDCAVALTFTARRVTLQDHNQQLVEAGLRGHDACVAAEREELRASGIGAFLDGECAKYLRQFKLELVPLYWMAIGYGQPDEPCNARASSEMPSFEEPSTTESTR